MSEERAPSSAPTGRLVLLALLALVAGASLLRWSLREVPLERDEGEYAYFGQLLLRGIPPWERAYNMKLPGIYLAYAGVLALFGQTASAVHTGLALAAALSALFLFLLVRRLVDPWTGVAAAGLLLLLELAPSVQGLFANAEHFVLPWALAGLWLLARSADEDRPRDRLLGGLALGCALLTKQHGAFFVLAGGLFVVLHAWRTADGERPLARALRRGAAFSAAALTPLAAACAWLAAAGVFPRFWFWTVTYGRAYTQQTTLAQAWPGLAQRLESLVTDAPLALALGAAGLVALLAWPRARRRLDLSLPFVALSCLAVTPGFLFRPHYFVLLLPAAAFLGGLGVRALAQLARRAVPARGAALIGALLFTGAVGQGLFAQRTVLFRLTPYQIARGQYGPNPFPESEAIARWIRDDTRPQDTIAVLGSEPQIYFHARRLSATGYVYTYAPMETHAFAEAMQREMIREIESRAPAYVVWVNYVLSWLPREGSSTLLLSWARRYLADYDLVARVEVTAFSSRFLRAEELSAPPGPPTLDLDPGKCVLDLYRRRRPTVDDPR